MSIAVHNMSSPEFEQSTDFSLFPDSPMMPGQGLQYSGPQFGLDGYFPGLYNQGVMRGMTPGAFVEAPQFPHDSPQGHAYTSTTPSGQSSAVSSPHSMPHSTVPRPEWGQMELAPAIVEYDNFALGGGYQYQPSGMEEFALFQPSKGDHFVDPSILHPTTTVRPSSATQSHDTSMYPPPSTYPGSPSISQMSRSPYHAQDAQSPYMHPYYSYQSGRRPSVSSHQSYNSQEGPYSGDENEKGRCNYPDCGKVFKDLKAHMLTHQSERPEKCPIITCEYHTKGFARKYDKNRHTLTHYKGTMVCGFCPGSGSAAEKSFNRADVFKRHLTSVHSVEQTPPNSRKKTTGTSTSKKLTSYAPDATGKCSTCSGVFSNAQEFYEHLDDCVLRIVQQEEPSEAINAARLAEVEKDRDVHDTLRNHALPTTTKIYSANDEDDEEDDDDADDVTVEDLRLKNLRKSKGNRNPVNGVQKSRGLTHSKGGVTLNTRGRKKRKDYPSSWGCPSSQMKMKKRVLTVFDGPRRLWKDDMMLDTDYEVRMKLSDEKSYVTDLDIQSMRRAEALHNADEEEKGPWISDDLTGLDLEKLMEVHHADES